MKIEDTKTRIQQLEVELGRTLSRLGEAEEAAVALRRMRDNIRGGIAELRRMLSLEKKEDEPETTDTEETGGKE